MRHTCGWLVLAMGLTAGSLQAGTLDLEAEGNTIGEHWQDSSYYTLERGRIITKYHRESSESLIEEYSYELPTGVELEDILSWEPETIHTPYAEYWLSCEINSGNQIECEWTDMPPGPPGPPGKPIVVE